MLIVELFLRSLVKLYGRHILNESRNRINIPPEQFLNNLKVGEDACVFFSSKEELQMIHFAFVKSGLENNWGIVYATATESIDEVRNAMQIYGINTQYYEKGGGGEGRQGNGIRVLYNKRRRLVQECR